ncbi:hypothetical protein [Aeromicrobium sp.]|uniref:hypothetical protein n=1 Tax=Aeromicrobium sp. TaxID=1871063 RepID=UPI002FC8582E
MADALTMKVGRDFDVITTLPKRINGQVAYYQGVSPDGIVYGSTAEEDPEADQPLGGGSTLITTRDDVFLFNPQTGKVTSISDGASRSQQVAVRGIDVNDEWVTWIEVQEAYNARWTLHSYDRSTGKERRLGSQKDGVEGDTGIADGAKISGNRVLISTFGFGDEDAKAKRAENSQILSAPLDGSAPLTELVNGATGASVDADGMSYVDVATDALTFRDARSGKTKVLNVGKTNVEDYLECALYDERVLMTCEGSGVNRSIRIKTNDGKPVSFGPLADDFWYFALDSGWAKFVLDPDGQPKIYAIDTKRMKLFKVADTQGGWDLMGDDFALVRPFAGAKGEIWLIKLR